MTDALDVFPPAVGASSAQSGLGEIMRIAFVTIVRRANSPLLEDLVAIDTLSYSGYQECFSLDVVGCE